MVFLYILGVIIALVIDYFVALKFATIAELKGHSGDEYFWYTFLLNIVGMFMVIALPDHSQGRTAQTAKELPPQKDIFKSVRKPTASSAQKRCPYCGDIVKNGRCEMCGKEVL